MSGLAPIITKLLQDLVSRGILLQNGQGRWTQYCLPSDLELNSLRIDDHSVHKSDHSVHKDNHSVHKEENSDEQWASLTKIAETARQNKRLPPKEMESIILQLCNDHWITRKQISDLLQRNPDSLRSRFLTSMVEHGLPQLRYPDKPNRTDQAYKTALPPK
jgi:ATP-dependent DNA helicase RecG